MRREAMLKILEDTNRNRIRVICNAVKPPLHYKKVIRDPFLFCRHKPRSVRLSVSSS